MTGAAAIAPHAVLRAATAECHAEVDAAFARFDLADRRLYTDFLTAHARVLPALEQRLAAVLGLPRFDPRAPLLAADLAGLDASMPDPLPVMRPASPAAAWGMLYVMEGSRLGGVFLARQVGEGLPRAYLGAAHARGGWKTLLQELDAAGSDGSADWAADAEAAARSTFSLYRLVAEPA